MDAISTQAGWNNRQGLKPFISSPFFINADKNIPVTLIATLPNIMTMNAQFSPSSPIDLNDIKHLLDDEMLAVNHFIADKLGSKVELINEIGCYIINNGGKKLRPLLLLLIAKALGAVTPHHIGLAVAIEFLHTASLLHDDVIDQANLRRGKTSANRLWGNASSILTGDFLYSKAFQFIAQTGNVAVVDIAAKTIGTLAEGELLQLHNCRNPGTTESDYLEVIRCKTAILFSTSAQLAAIISEAGTEQIEGLMSYAHALGMAFQLTDDVLDYNSTPEALGKNLGADLAEGKATLPLIYAMKHAPADEANLIIEALKTGDSGAFQDVFQVVVKTDALAYTLARAEEQALSATAALSVLPDSDYKDALAALAHFSCHRHC